MKNVSSHRGIDTSSIRSRSIEFSLHFSSTTTGPVTFCLFTRLFTARSACIHLTGRNQPYKLLSSLSLSENPVLFPALCPRFPLIIIFLSFHYSLPVLRTNLRTISAISSCYYIYSFRGSRDGATVRGQIIGWGKILYYW